MTTASHVVLTTLALSFTVSGLAAAFQGAPCGDGGGGCRQLPAAGVVLPAEALPADALPAVATTEGDVTSAAMPSSGLDAGAPIDLALCLDTSGSMSGLIDSAKEKLWTIVNELGRASPQPTLRVALLTYGNDSLSPEDGWVSLDVPFTEDLDLISEHLFALQTNGGTELVGRVVSVAHGRLDWSDAGHGLRMIVVAGNESADQDQVVPALAAVAGATRADVVVNSIYCGNPEDEIAPGWRNVALAGLGHFACIDKDEGTRHVVTPHDELMAELSGALNATYLPFGSLGAKACSNQFAQDSNAVSLNWSAAAERAVTKSGANYSCASWDLVDACRQPDFELSDVAEADIPDVLKPLGQAQRVAHIELLFTRRQELKERIHGLELQRHAWLADARSEGLLGDESAFDHAVRQALRTQAEARGFVFDVEPAAPTPRLVIPRGAPSVLLPARADSPRPQSLAQALNDGC